MEKNIAALEICSSQVKLVVGYVKDNQVYVIYTACKPFDGINDRGDISNPEVIAAAIKEITSINEDNSKIIGVISEVYLSLPACGMLLYKVKPSTSINDTEQRKISKTDINVLVNVIKGYSYGNPDNRIVTIKPDYYLVDGVSKYLELPLNVPGNTITLSAGVYTLPSKIITKYLNFVTSGSLSIKDYKISTYACVNLLSRYPGIPNDYVLIDIGSHSTIVSYIGEKVLYATRHFIWGGDNVTNAIANAFKIDTKKAEELKILYGLNPKTMNFKVPCLKAKEKTYYLEDLTAIVKNEVEIFIKMLDTNLNNIFSTTKNILRLPFLLIGGGSKLPGFTQYLDKYYDSRQVKNIYPNSLGARDSAFFNCLGAIYCSSLTNIDSAHSTYSNKLVDGVTRENK